MMDFPAHTDQSEKYAARRLRMLEMLWEAALRGLPCPSNQEFGAELRVAGSTASNILFMLERDGRVVIKRSRKGGPRVVTLKASGLTTADFVRDTIEAALDNVALQFGIARHVLKGPERRKHQVRARQAFCLLAQEGGATSSQIGAVLARDHSTVVYAWAEAKKWEQRDPEFGRRIVAARTQVFGAA